jgi:2-polyprenyl-3-methyl-5-hydroxy-6-metoxy-1,4-benzoquinol methylase
MRRIYLNEKWPASWKSSYNFDLDEVFGDISHYGYAYAYDNRRKMALRLLTDVLPRGARILDVAAAQGNFSLSLAELGYDVTWNDLRTELADYVRLKHEFGTIAFVPGNAFELGFTIPFDGVLITEIIEHVAHPDEFLKKTASFVKPGGYVVMTTPNGAYFRNSLPKFSECRDPSVYEVFQFKPNADGHIFLLHPDEIEPLGVSAGLELDEFCLFTNLLTCGRLKTEILLRALSNHTIEYFERLTQLLPRWLRSKILVQMGVRFLKPQND